MELTILDQGAKIIPGWKTDIDDLAEGIHQRYPQAARMEVVLTRHPHCTKGPKSAEILVSVTLISGQLIASHTFEPMFSTAIQSGFALLDAELQRADGMSPLEAVQEVSKSLNAPSQTAM